MFRQQLWRIHHEDRVTPGRVELSGYVYPVSEFPRSHIAFNQRYPAPVIVKMELNLKIRIPAQEGFGTIEEDSLYSG